MSKPSKEQDKTGAPGEPEGRASGGRGTGLQWAGARRDPRPVYRVVELVRNADGRLRKQGKIWHVDLDVPRKFGRAMAANTSSHRIVIEDNHGRVLEELPVCGPGERQAAWSHWEDIPLPRLAPLPPPARKLPVLEPARAEFAGGDGDEDEDEEEREERLAAEQGLDVAI